MVSRGALTWGLAAVACSKRGLAKGVSSSTTGCGGSMLCRRVCIVLPIRASGKELGDSDRSIGTITGDCLGRLAPLAVEISIQHGVQTCCPTSIRDFTARWNPAAPYLPFRRETRTWKRWYEGRCRCDRELCDATFATWWPESPM